MIRHPHPHWASKPRNGRWRWNTALGQWDVAPVIRAQAPARAATPALQTEPDPVAVRVDLLLGIREP